MGTAPGPTTTLVFSDVPNAMLVSTHEASNCSNNLCGTCTSSQIKFNENHAPKLCSMKLNLKADYQI
jgi:hypothetical protein